MSQPFKYYTQVKVRFNETDAQGHVNFGHYLFYFDVAVTDYLEAVGYSYKVMAADGVDMLYVGSRTSYKSPAYFEEVLNVHATVGKFGNSSARFDFQVFAEGDGRAIAEGEITVVMVTRENRHKIPVPAKLRDSVARFEAATPSLGSTPARNEN